MDFCCSQKLRKEQVSSHVTKYTVCQTRDSQMQPSKIQVKRQSNFSQRGCKLNLHSQSQSIIFHLHLHSGFSPFFPEVRAAYNDAECIVDVTTLVALYSFMMMMSRQQVYDIHHYRKWAESAQNVQTNSPNIGMTKVTSFRNHFSIFLQLERKSKSF